MFLLLIPFCNLPLKLQAGKVHGLQCSARKAAITALNYAAVWLASCQTSRCSCQRYAGQQVMLSCTHILSTRLEEDQRTVQRQHCNKQLP